MTQRITAIYEDGVLRPLSPLNLTEHSKVEIAVYQSSSQSDEQSHREMVDKILLDSGLWSPVQDASDEILTPLSDQRRQELADLLAVGGPLSEAINEEREGR